MVDITRVKDATDGLQQNSKPTDTTKSRIDLWPTSLCERPSWRLSTKQTTDQHKQTKDRPLTDITLREGLPAGRRQNIKPTDTAKNMFLSYYYYLTFMRELANEIWLFRTQTKCCWYYSNILIMNPRFYYHGKVKTKFPNILQYALLQTFKSNLMSILPLYKYYNH